MNFSRSGKRIHVWLEGQYDNIGDSALRRAYLRALENLGPVSVWAGSFSGYNRGLGIREASQLRPSYRQWLFALYKDVLRGNAVIALNAGQFGISRQFAGRLVALFPALILLRLRGGSNIWLGAATTPRLGRTWLLRALARLTTFLRWRDSDTPREVFASLTMPDWAFDLGPDAPGGENHDHIAVSLRGDRPFPSSEWTEALKGVAERLRLSIVVVVQVARDQERGQQLAGALGAELVDWRSDDHDEQEATVRAIYRSSALVLSDRLHALIIAHTEGAVPLGWCESAGKKVRQHFDVVGFGQAAPEPSVVSQLDLLGPASIVALKNDAAATLMHARQELAGVKGELSVHLGFSGDSGQM